MHRYRNGIRTDDKGKRFFDREFRVKVLEFLDGGNKENEACLTFSITKRELKRITTWRKRMGEVPHRKELVAKERTLKERLQERSIASLEQSMAPLSEVVQDPTVQAKPELLPTAVNHLKNRGIIAVKVLEGLGDFRKGGDDAPREGLRQPLFNLPVGAHVSVTLDISQGALNGNQERSLEIPATVESEVQEG